MQLTPDRRRTGHRAFVALALAALLPALTGTTTAPPPSTPRAAAAVPLTAGIAVLDRRTGAFTERHHADRRFRSASVVKLLIALDYLWTRGPSYAVPPADRRRLAAMLRSSDDSAAGDFWKRGGGAAVVTRMASRLALTRTAGPPPGYPGFWGYTAVTAADTVKVYRYLLDSAPPAVRDFVLGRLRRSTRCAADGFDQRFGIPGAFERPWAVKQGWSGFGAAGGCGGHRRADGGAPAAGPRTAGPGGLDLVREALHTTGTVGAGDRSIVAVLSLHPDGTPYGTATARLTALTRSLRVPGGVRTAHGQP